MWSNRFHLKHMVILSLILFRSSHTIPGAHPWCCSKTPEICCITTHVSVPKSQLCVNTSLPHPRLCLSLHREIHRVTLHQPPHPSFSCLTTEVINLRFPPASLTLGGAPPPAIITLSPPLAIRIYDDAQSVQQNPHNNSPMSLNLIISGTCF